MRERLSSQSGLSLVETMVSLVLLSIVGYFIMASQNKAQKIMFKGTSRDAHTQIVSVVKSKTGKTLQQILSTANNNPADLDGILNTELNLGEAIRLSWAKPVGREKTVTMQYLAQADPVAQQAKEACRKSQTFKKAWEGIELPQRLASQRMMFCGQMLMPANPDKNYGSQSMAQAQYGFLTLDVSFTKVIDGTAIPLSAFGPGETLATVTWTMVWSYQRNQENVQQFRKGVYHIVP